MKNDELKSIFNMVNKMSMEDAVEFLGIFLPKKITAELFESYGMLVELYCHYIKLLKNKDEAISIIQNLIDKDFLLNGESYWYYHQKAHISKELNNDIYGGGDGLYALAAYKAKNFSLFHITRGILIHRPLEVVRMFKNELAETMPDICQINRKAQKCLFIVSADAVYFKEYAQIFYKSVMEYSDEDSNIGVHFHIINPDEECFEIINLYKLPNYSVEYKNLSDYVKKAYYTIPRYSIISLLDKLYDCENYIVADIDVAINKNINAFLKYMNSYNFGLVINSSIDSKMSYPWSSICAGLAYFKKCDEMYKFVQCYDNYVKFVFDDTLQSQNANWLIDQMALWYAYNEVVKHSSCKGISRSTLAMAAQLHDGGKKGFLKYYRDKYNIKK